MDYGKKKLLYTDDARITTIDGKFICSVSMTDRAVELSDNVGWITGDESWLAYRNRTKQERVNEELKRVQIASDLVMAYNKTNNFT